ncbi:MAG: hypothetical protein LBG15_05645, partial [Dysgonamonadaceae bacterium]|nr:hypothetical protein [Dysgonamonadaceae bacterium]
KSVSSADIQDKAVTAAKLNSMSATSGQVLKYNGSAWAPATETGLTTEADGIIGNEVTNATSSGGLTRSGSGTAGSPYTLGIADNGVTSARIAADAVDSTKIAPKAVSSTDIADNAVTTAKIRDANVTTKKINPGANGQILTTLNGAVAWSGTTPTFGQMLYYNGSGWVAGTLKSFLITSEEYIAQVPYTIDLDLSSECTIVSFLYIQKYKYGTAPNYVTKDGNRDFLSYAITGNNSVRLTVSGASVDVEKYDVRIELNCLCIK